jgi:predicted DNA binding protein
LNIAIKNGYYNFPRKNDLNKLSKIAKVSKQTFQENLRKAENKLIPFLVGE